ncbi:MAG: iron-containing redox enzyme family protein [Pyrinomonadaceae bacterium]
MELNPETEFAALDRLVDGTWDDILTHSRLAQSIRSGSVSRELYMIYMIETFHYTSHNARNQAAAGVMQAHHPVYAKFCFEHAAEETGHERMALHDLLSLGPGSTELALPPPLPATETLIAYLYWVSTQGNPYRRLGYSYWAESSYRHILPLVRGVKESLGLSDSQLTFFIAHSAIDDAHARQVRSIIERTCRSAEDWQMLGEAAETSLRLTGSMLESVYDQYETLRQGRPSRYDDVRRRLLAEP